MRVRKSKRMGWTEGRLRERLRGEPEGSRKFGRSRRRLENNIKIDLNEQASGVDWNNLIRNRLVTVLNIGHTSEIRASKM